MEQSTLNVVAALTQAIATQSAAKAGDQFVIGEGNQSSMASYHQTSLTLYLSYDSSLIKRKEIKLNPLGRKTGDI